jgi:hypothetical protein
MVRTETEAGIHAKAGFAQLDQRLEASMEALHEFLRELKASGKRVAGYGASVGTTTFLHRFRAGGFLDFIVDDNPDKHGLFSPGFHLPVLPSEALYSERPDYVLILAWRYADPIIRKHQRFVEQGGRFIRPWPTLAVS